MPGKKICLSMRTESLCWSFASAKALFAETIKKEQFRFPGVKPRNHFLLRLIKDSSSFLISADNLTFAKWSDIVLRQESISVTSKCIPMIENWSDRKGCCDLQSKILENTRMNVKRSRILAVQEIILIELVCREQMFAN